jgi:hypothetical protein
VKQVPGWKTDKADARWLAKLMRYGLLQASLIPPAEQRDLRDLRRYRTKLVQEHNREVNRVQGVLERANIKLAAVAKGRLRTKIPVLEQALIGLVRDHHRQLLAIQLAHIDFVDEQIDALSSEITSRLTALHQGEPPVPPADTTGTTGGAAAPGAPAEPMTFARALSGLQSTVTNLRSPTSVLSDVWLASANGPAHGMLSSCSSGCRSVYIAFYATGPSSPAASSARPSRVGTKRYPRSCSVLMTRCARPLSPTALRAAIMQ